MGNDYIKVFFCDSTADDEENYFNGDDVHDDQKQEKDDIIEGKYRIVDQELYRIE